MKHLRNLLFLSILISSTLIAQQVDVAITYLRAFPVGAYNLNASSGDGFLATNWPTEIIPGNAQGAGIQLSYRFEFGLSIGLEANYLNYEEKTQGSSFLGILDNTSGASAIAIPLFISANYYFLDDWFKPHAGLGVGYVFHQSTVIGQGLLGLAQNKLRYNQDGFVFSPRIGILFEVTDYLAFDLHAQYNFAFNDLTDAEGVSRTADDFELVEVLNASSTDNISAGIGVVFTILSND